MEFEKADVTLDEMNTNQSKYIQEEILKKRFKTVILLFFCFKINRLFSLKLNGLRLMKN